MGTNNPVSRDGKSKWAGNSAGGQVMCLDERTGKLLWDLAMPRLPEQRAPHSDNGYGVCSSSTIEGNRVYVVSDRTDVLCLDIEGLANGNDGPFHDEAAYRRRSDDVKAVRGPKSSCGPPTPTSSGVTTSSRSWMPIRTTPRPAGRGDLRRLPLRMYRQRDQRCTRTRCSIRWPPV